ncbi:hypothetical protein QZM56_37280 [Burkholderia contaminans]|jgi:hypothetical protein|uniref:Uncharacterized protein n=3 Tax=Burkholderia cepacia complex TaxID=87882 RepID=A0AAP4VLU9_9BURK|nr:MULTISPECIES: hypothetical protein [Burkholderia]MBX3932905.1 hypothetical protein [Burkholderia contaminans]MCA7880909.1 hypothetical protein [Burkholderia contaminans]MDN7570150.1 hypothetical protein [Burkholderia contaminans]
MAILSLLHLRRKRGRMPGISLQELAFAYRTGEKCEIWVVEIVEEGRPLWIVQVFLFEQEKLFTLQGQRGKQRTWRDFDRVMGVLKEACPKLSEIKVKFAAEAESAQDGGHQGEEGK